METTAFLLLVVLLVGGASAQSGPTAGTPFFPTAVGTQWLYQAHVKWTVAGSNQVRQSHVTWPVEVKRSIERATFSAILLSGFPNDLAWYEPGKAPGHHTIVQIGSAVYLISDDRADALLSAAEEAKTADDLRGFLRPDDLWFRLPLEDGAHYCTADHPKAQGSFYCWHVDGVTQLAASDVIGAPAGVHTGFELWYQSNPDHQIYTLTPGVGVWTYTYAHHGTTAEADVKLMKFSPVSSKRKPLAR